MRAITRRTIKITQYRSKSNKAVTWLFVSGEDRCTAISSKVGTRIARHILLYTPLHNSRSRKYVVSAHEAELLGF